MLLKIVPFLVWYRAYGPRAGRAPVPTLAELSDPALEAAAYAFLTAGVAALATAVTVGEAVWIRVAAIVLAAGAVALALALSRVLRHLATPRPGRAAATPAGASA
jgi:hypothetical protein